jgi:hypothetical protein
VDELEQEIKEMKDGACSSRLKKISPSPEVRVSDIHRHIKFLGVYNQMGRGTIKEM